MIFNQDITDDCELPLPKIVTHP